MNKLLLTLLFSLSIVFSMAQTCLTDALSSASTTPVNPMIGWCVLADSIQPVNHMLTDGDISGVNPCIEFDDFGCGLYWLGAKDTSTTCTNCDTINAVPFLNCCLNANCVTIDNTDCDNCDGQLIVTVSDGNFPYTFDDGTTTNNTGVFTGLCGGSYTVTVTDDNGCSTIVSCTVDEDCGTSCTPSATIVSGSVMESCSNGDYRIEFNPTLSCELCGTCAGPNPSPYTLSWDILINGSLYSTSILTQTVSGCGHTFGFVETIDCDDVTEGDVVTISVNPIVFNMQCSPFALATTPQYVEAFTVTNAIFNNCCDPCPTETLTVSGSCTLLTATTSITPASCGEPVIYSWYIVGNPSPLQFGPSNTYVPTVSGDYYVIIFCGTCLYQSPNFTVDCGSPCTLTTSISGNLSFCTGSTTTLTANPSGGTTPYTYSWSNSSMMSSITVSSGGSYSVTVTDNASCTAAASVIVNEISPCVAVISNTPTNPSCNQLASYSALNCSGATYSWSTTGAGSFSGTGLNYSFTPTANGTYTTTLTVTDACGTTTDTHSFTITDCAVACDCVSGVNNIDNGACTFDYFVVGPDCDCTWEIWRRPQGATAWNTVLSGSGVVSSTFTHTASLGAYEYLFFVSCNSACGGGIFPNINGFLLDCCVNDIDLFSEGISLACGSNEDFNFVADYSAACNFCTGCNPNLSAIDVDIDVKINGITFMTFTETGISCTTDMSSSFTIPCDDLEAGDNVSWSASISETICGEFINSGISQTITVTQQDKDDCCCVPEIMSGMMISGGIPSYACPEIEIPFTYTVDVVCTECCTDPFTIRYERIELVNLAIGGGPKFLTYTEAFCGFGPIILDFSFFAVDVCVLQVGDEIGYYYDLIIDSSSCNHDFPPIIEFIHTITQVDRDACGCP